MNNRYIKHNAYGRMQMVDKNVRTPAMHVVVNGIKMDIRIRLRPVAHTNAIYFR